MSKTLCFAIVYVQCTCKKGFYTYGKTSVNASILDMNKKLFKQEISENTFEGLYAF